MQESQQTEDRKNSDEGNKFAHLGTWQGAAPGTVSVCRRLHSRALKAVLGIAFLPKEQWNSINKLVNSLSNLHLNASPLLQKC